MAIAVAEAAVAAGLRIVLLPAAYHRNGWDGADRPPQPGQRRFCDPDVETFLHRVDDLRAWAADRDGVTVGLAAHSVRAVPAAWLEAIAAHAREHDLVLPRPRPRAAPRARASATPSTAARRSSCSRAPASSASARASSTAST